LPRPRRVSLGRGARGDVIGACRHSACRGPISPGQPACTTGTGGCRRPSTCAKYAQARCTSGRSGWFWACVSALSHVRSYHPGEIVFADP
jgi:hypothetical protein